VNAGGAELGNVDGRIEVSATSGPWDSGLKVQIAVPQLRVILPERSSVDVQALGPMADVRIGAHRGSRATFVLLPAPSIEARRETSSGPAIDVHLDDVELVRGTDLKIDLEGDLRVRSGATAAVTGQIRLKSGGLLAVEGRNFTIDSGTVTLVGQDPTNPEVVVKAGYKAPDGTTVYATFVGPLKTGKVTLTSEPSLPQQEIVELLLFGTAGGPQVQAASGSPETSLVGIAGGEAAQPLNHLLSELGVGAVRADVDATNSANLRPGVEVQIARNISLKLAVVLGQLPPGVNPDTTLLTVAWRFLSRWSLSSTVGNVGTTIFDLLWQRRY
jgi:translocation and assembly module TamB